MKNITTNLKTGLTSQQVRERIKKGERNVNIGSKTKTVKEILFSNIFTFFNLINFVLAALVLYVGSYRNLLFLFIVLCNIIIGSYQEIKAKKTLDRLSLLASTDVNVLRNGKIERISEKDIVLGDILILSSGDQIPADAILETGSLQVNDSLLTGESTPVLKKVGSQLLSGSVVIGGRGKACVNEVGAQSFTGKLAREADKLNSRQSEIQSSLDSLIKIIALLLIPIGLLLFAKDYYFLHTNFTTTIDSTVAALIAMIPQGLVLLISMVFAAAVIKLAKDHVLVQRMSTIPTLARIDMLCLDKTGTITEGKLDLIEIVPFDNYTDKALKQILANIIKELDDGDPTVESIKEYLNDEREEKNVEIVKTVPFSSLHKYSGVSYKLDDKLTSVVIGSAPFVLGDRIGLVKKDLEYYTHEGDYVMLMAVSDEPFDGENLPQNLKPCALIVYRDKLRPSVPAALKFFLDEGVPIKIVSGDNPVTASATAKRAGLPDYEKTANAMDLKSFEQVKEAVKTTGVFGNCLPKQKEQVVQALEEEGYTVGYVGNGVNDILALKKADISAAVADGAQAACVVSDLVLLNSSFTPLPKIVVEGRKLINNLQRSAVLYLSKTIFATLIVILYLFLPTAYPFEPIQFSLVNAVTIGIPSFVLAFEPNNELVRGKFLNNVMLKAIPGGLVMFIGVGLVGVLGFLMHLPMEIISTLSVYLLTSAGLMIVFRISRPFNMYRSVLFVSLIIIFLGAVFFARGFFLLSNLNLTAILLGVSVLIVELLFTLVLNRRGIASDLRNAFMKIYKTIEMNKLLHKIPDRY